jgi:hypothetical protein
MVGGWRKLHNEEASQFVLLVKYNYNDRIKEDKVSKACSTHRREEECI